MNTFANIEVELRRDVGGVNTPVGSRDSVYNFAVLLVTSDDIMTSLLKKLSISIEIHVVKPLWSLNNQFPNCRPNPYVGSRRELVANLVHIADATQLDS